MVKSAFTADLHVHSADQSEVKQSETGTATSVVSIDLMIRIIFCWAFTFLNHSCFTEQSRPYSVCIPCDSGPPDGLTDTQAK